MATPPAWVCPRCGTVWSYWVMSCRCPSRTVAGTSTDVPPFDPDPELIAHMEGNKRSLRGYRRKAEQMRQEAALPQ